MIINEKTKLPLFTVFFFLPSIVGASFWISTVSSRSVTNSERIDRITDKIRRMDDLSELRYNKALDILTDVRERTIRIEQWQKDLKYNK